MLDENDFKHHSSIINRQKLKNYSNNNITDSHLDNNKSIKLNLFDQVI